MKKSKEIRIISISEIMDYKRSLIVVTIADGSTLKAMVSDCMEVHDVLPWKERFYWKRKESMD